MRAKIEQKLRAIELRKQGLSVSEIVEKLSVAKSSISVWVRNVPLSEGARNRLLTKIKLGQVVSVERKREKTKEKLDRLSIESKKELINLKFSPIQTKFLCSVIYWCEGVKNYSYGVAFINSDPRLIKTFLSLFRKSFPLDERKFRCCLHLHEYHDIERQISYWVEITKIRKEQFIKPYIKPHTGKRIKIDYPGCLSVRYHDSNIGRQLYVLGEEFIKKMGL